MCMNLTSSIVYFLENTFLAYFVTLCLYYKIESYPDEIKVPAKTEGGKHWPKVKKKLCSKYGVNIKCRHVLSSYLLRIKGTSRGESNQNFSDQP